VLQEIFPRPQRLLSCFNTASAVYVQPEALAGGALTESATVAAATMVAARMRILRVRCIIHLRCRRPNPWRGLRTQQTGSKMGNLLVSKVDYRPEPQLVNALRQSLRQTFRLVSCLSLGPLEHQIDHHVRDRQIETLARTLEHVLLEPVRTPRRMGGDDDLLRSERA
jgi:hypothetical protein